MTVYSKIKTLREEKKISQECIAYQLGMNQSQYSRRESGEICFVVDDLIKLAVILKVPVSAFFLEQFSNNELQTPAETQQYPAIFKKLIEQYEKRISEKDKLIEILQKDVFTNRIA